MSKPSFTKGTENRVMSNRGAKMQTTRDQQPRRTESAKALRDGHALGKVILAVLVSVCLTAPVAVGAFPFNASTDHPRIFVGQGDLPVLASRAGISETGMPPKTVLSWQSHMPEWNKVKSMAWSSPDHLVLEQSGSSGFWSKTDARKVDEYLSNQAVVYYLTQGQPEGPQMAQRLIRYLQDIVDDSRGRNGGSIGPSIEDNDWGKNAVYKGFCMAYDYVYPYLINQNPQLAEDYARWLYEQGKEAYGAISYLGEDVGLYKHYYNVSWMADGVVAAFLAMWGDIPSLQSDIYQKLNYALDFKWEDYRARALNYYGTYSGYREERVEEDLITAALISSCLLNRDPFDEFGDHLLNIDDWVMYMTRGDQGMSDETGDKPDLGPLKGYFKVFPYISAERNRDSKTLWFLDLMLRLDGEPGLEVGEPWVFLLWNDRTIPRTPPALSQVPLSRFFGDLTWEDGGNSQYAHFRSQWVYGEPLGSAVVMASFLCGPLAGGHDTASNGHFAIFRGGDILTCSAGVYDGTAFDHTKNYSQPPISENTILIYQPNSPYLDENTHGTSFPHTEGMQAPAPGTTGGNGIYTAEHPFDDEHEMGHVTKFAYVKEAGRQISRLECDITDGYPNTGKPDLWQEGQLVDAVLREFLFLAGRYFVVYDRINATSSAYKKSIIIHSTDKTMPRVLDGSWSGGTQPHPGPYGGTPGVWTPDGSKFYWDKGNSRLFITTHLPSTQTGRRVIAIGGTNASGEWNQTNSYEFWHRRAGVQYPWDDQYLNDNEIEEQIESGWAGWWRLEIEPAQDVREERFLTVLEATGKTQSQPVESQRLASDASTVALSIADPGEPIVIALPLGLEPLEDLWYDYDPQGSILEEDPGASYATHVVDGLDPGAYAVLLEPCSGRDRPELVHRGETTEDGMLTFRVARSGRFHVVADEMAAGPSPGVMLLLARLR